ncbi:MAG: hypothetical protein ACI9HK_005567 [Pirellulaceae bacterium]
MVRITADLSLYPLLSSYIPKIEAFVREIQETPGLEVVVNQLSTQIRGEVSEVTRAVEAALVMSFRGGESQVLVVKYLNADLPIGEAPVLGPPG